MKILRNNMGIANGYANVTNYFYIYAFPFCAANNMRNVFINN